MTSKQEEATVPVEKLPNYHRLEVTLNPRQGEVTFKGVCDAPIGTVCRMWCDVELCAEGYQEGHENHVLFDQGNCGYIETLNGDPSYIPECYTGPETPLRSGHIDVLLDIDGASWEYSNLIYAYSPEENPQVAAHWFYQEGGEWMAVADWESVSDWFADIDGGFQPWMVRAIADVPGGTRHFRDESGKEYSLDPSLIAINERAELEEYRRRDAAGWTEYALHIPGDPDGAPENHKGLNQASAIRLRDFAQKRGYPLTEVVQRQHPAQGPWVPAQGPVCEAKCGHQCGECRLGLGTHRPCDPRCDHHLPAKQPTG